MATNYTMGKPKETPKGMYRCRTCGALLGEKAAVRLYRMTWCIDCYCKNKAEAEKDN